jgi:hypothetical protein
MLRLRLAAPMMFFWNVPMRPRAWETCEIASPTIF